MPIEPTAGAGSTVMAVQLPRLVPHPFPAVTQIVPDVAAYVTVIDLVPCPAVMAAPAGIVHVYTVVRGSAVTE